MAIAHCHPHDKKWLDEQLKRVPPAFRYSIEKKYSAAFEGGATRCECNTRLREYIEKLLETMR